jgi:hypothetical protein
MYAWLPDDVRLETDVTPASWVVERFRPWGVAFPQPVACFMPDVFEAYARVLHPGYEKMISASDGAVTLRWVRWSELAELRDVEVTATTRWEDVTGLVPQTGSGGAIREPSDGSMHEDLTEAVAAFLNTWTATPPKCWFGMWEGNGTWWKGAHGTLTSRALDVVLNTDDRDAIAAIEAEADRIDEERDQVLRTTATFGTPQRQYFLMSGPLAAAGRLTEAAGGSSPNLLWPEDRAWFVSTEVDGYSTYIGGPASMIGALIASPTIEAVAVSVDGPIAY